MNVDTSDEGSFYRRGNGLWVGSAWVVLPDGTRTRRHVSGRDEDRTRAKWEALREQAARGVAPVEPGLSTGRYLEYWLEQVVLPARRPATHASYEYLVRTRIAPHLGRVRLDRLSVTDVRRWIVALQQAGDSPRMVQVCRAVLRSALTNAVMEERVQRNVATLITVPKPPRKEIRPWNAQEATAFLAATRNHRLHTAFTLMLMLGLRRGEALGVSWDDLDLDEGLVTLRHQVQRGKKGLVLQPLKTDGSAATLPLPTPVVAVLLERQAIQKLEAAREGWENWKDASLVSTTLDGGAIEPRNLNHAFTRATKHAALRTIRVHDTRHTCASLLRSYGVDLAVIQRILRHTQLSTTADVYLHIDHDDQRAALKKIADALDDAA